MRPASGPDRSERAGESTTTAADSRRSSIPLDRGPGGPTPTEAGALLLAHADARGLAVRLAPRLLAGRLAGVAMIPLRDAVPRRAFYALTPAAGARPAAHDFVAALAEALPR